ncbi:PREDICTED: PDZ domain-containing protein 2-like isoform X2 [Poecilia mexicana]|uniref:PDZ domain-containing protein 2-like isoform X2 n=1 Tax=Poecilia mexicana TaxID=48701 RepID=UPI00072E67D8|nr:PREDICTED: PDZ domain-containing protein 2-like isoform X2 [Poecilia mexicana]
MDHCQTQQDITDFEMVNCKRTRKLGVISQSSNQGYRESTASQIKTRNQYSLFNTDEEVSSSLEDCCPDLSPQTRTIHSYNGSAGTLPGRSHSQVLECKMQSFTSEATTQLREGSHIWKMHMVKGHEGLGIQITGGCGSKRSSHGIIITHIEKGGAIHRDGRLHVGDELLMVNGQSLVGLTHQEAVSFLRSTTGLVQLVVSSQLSPLENLEEFNQGKASETCCCSSTPMKLTCQSQGGSSCLESVGEDNELFVESIISGGEVAEKPLSGRRKHSLPHQLDSARVRQVSEFFTQHKTEDARMNIQGLLLF